MKLNKTAGNIIIVICGAIFFFIAACGSWGIDSWAKSTVNGHGALSGIFSAVGNGSETVDPIITGSTQLLLYYTEDDPSGKYIYHRYTRYFKLLNDDGCLLYDAARQLVFQGNYEDIIVLPYSYALKEDGKWRFYSRTDTPELLSDEEWDDIIPERSSRGKISTALITVCRDGKYGATDQYGEVIISPYWDELDTNTLYLDWPISRVKINGYYGYIDSSGRTIIRTEWDFADMETYIDPDTGKEAPIVYVYDGENWGGITRRGGSGDYSASRVNWDLKPSEDLIDSYMELIDQKLL